jgi:hypothetical protein
MVLVPRYFNKLLLAAYVRDWGGGSRFEITVGGPSVLYDKNGCRAVSTPFLMFL